MLPGSGTIKLVGSLSPQLGVQPSRREAADGLWAQMQMDPREEAQRQAAWG